MGLMENGGLSVADALALQDRGNCNDGMFGGNGSWVFFLFFLLAWGNGGLGGLGGNQSAITRADLSNGLNQQDIFRNQANIMQEIGAFERDATNNWGDMKYDNLIGVNNLTAAINQNRFDASKCCCETNRNIDAVRYENAKNSCDIINNANFNARDIIEAQNAGVQRIIDHMTNNEVQSLREKLQTATFQLSQQQQTADLMGKLRPCPIPAYPSCSPYQVFPNGCGNCGY